MMNDKDRAFVANKLQAPLVVSGIMDGGESLSDETRYALHCLISDMQPDSALLAIALAASNIASVHYASSPGIRILKLQSECIINDYAALWLQNAQGQAVSENDALETLSYVAEDLENLSELLELGMGAIESKDETANQLLDILLIQARAHSMVAEAFLDALEMNHDKEEEEMVGDSYAPPRLENNIIPFRARTQTKQAARATS